MKRKLLKYADQDEEDKIAILTMIGAKEMEVNTKKKNKNEAEPYFKPDAKGKILRIMH